MCRDALRYNLPRASLSLRFLRWGLLVVILRRTRGTRLLLLLGVEKELK